MIKLTEQQIKKIGEIQRMCIEHSIESNDDVNFEFSKWGKRVKVNVYENGYDAYGDSGPLLSRENLNGVTRELYTNIRANGDKYLAHTYSVDMCSVDDLDETLDKFIEKLQNIFEY